MECHDSLSKDQLKKKYPHEYERQKRIMLENKKKDVSELLDIFKKPMKDFDVVKGTPLENFEEPVWYYHYWEIYELRQAAAKDAMFEMDDDDVAVDKADESKSRQDTLEAETVISNYLDPTPDDVELEARPRKRASHRSALSRAAALVRNSFRT